MPKKNRLRGKKDLDEIFKNGHRIRGYSFLLIFSPFSASETVSESRVGVIVKKALEKRATRRNKIKRRIREILRKLLPFLQRGRYIFIVNPNAFQLSFKNLEADILNTLKKTKLINRSNYDKMAYAQHKIYQ